MKVPAARLSVVLVLLLASCGTRPRLGEAREEWLRGHADAAFELYQVALVDARALERAVGALIAAPTPRALEEARTAWIAARASYTRTEVFRFSGGPIDEVEKLIDAWPVDERVIDYVAEAPTAGMINDPEHHPELTAAHLAAMNEREGETAISTGYHAIEFLLWGQDRNPNGPGARPASDYLPTARGGRRRATYLREATALLVQHLARVDEAWAPGKPGNHRAHLLAGDPTEALAAAVRGAGTLLAAEVAGERLTVAYETKDQEDELSCFSDNTHEDLLGDLQGVDWLLRGTPRLGDRQPRPRPGVAALVALVDGGLSARLVAASQASLDAAAAIRPPFDRAIRGDDGAPGRRAVQATIRAVRAEADVLAHALPLLARRGE